MEIIETLRIIKQNNFKYNIFLNIRRYNCDMEMITECYGIDMTDF